MDLRLAEGGGGGGLTFMPEPLSLALQQLEATDTNDC
jgi:hypothetical protein